MIAMKGSRYGLERRYQQLLQKLKKFEVRYQQQLKRSVNNSLQLAKKAQRLQKIQRQVMRLSQRMRLAGAGLAIGALLLGANPAEAQTKTPAFAASVTNPFGFSDVGSRSNVDFADLDGDGDLDAFVGEVSTGTYYFENTGDANNPTFAAPVLNPFGLANTHTNTPVFADLDGDGDLDAYITEGSDNVRYYENTGDANNPTFNQVGLNPFGMTPQLAGNAPLNLVDLDGDGDLDALYNNNGNAQVANVYAENTGSAQAPAFAAAVFNPFGIATTGTYGAFAVVDLDGDGDLDVFREGLSGDVRYFENTGNAQNILFRDAGTNPFGITGTGGGTLRRARFADLDGDGDLDIFRGDLDGNIYYLENTGSNIGFALNAGVTNPFGFADIGGAADPSLVDLDHDGDLDAFVGGSDGNVYYFANTGSKTNPTFASVVTNPFGFTDVGTYASTTFSDIDGDGDLDAFVGAFDGNTYYFANTGNNTNPTFASAVTNPFGLTDVGYISQLAFADLDHDGDLDAFIGDYDGNMRYFQNTGNNTNPTFASVVTNPLGFTDVDFGADPSFVDLDKDGDLDAYVGNSDGNVLYFENTGNVTNPTFASAVTNPIGFADVGRYFSPSFADLDADGDLDALVGNHDGNMVYFENAPQYSWDGTSWSPSTPGSANNVAINGNYNTGTNGNISANGLTVNSTFTLTIADGTSVTLTGDLTNSGTVSVAKEGALIQSATAPSNSGTGTYTVQKDGAQHWFEYNYWASPLQTMTFAGAFNTPVANPNQYSYNATTQAWEAVSGTTSMTAGTGYIVSGNSANSGTLTRTFSNTSGFNSGNINHTLSFSNDADATNDWNLVGNPYPSGIDVAGFLSTNYNSGAGPIDNAVYIWNSDGNDVGGVTGDYAVMNSAGITNAGGNTAPSSATISSCQGFLVRATSAGNVSFQNSHRTATNNTFLRTGVDKSSWLRAWITASHEDGYKNEILVGFMPDAQIEKDQYDAVKLDGNNQLSLYMRQGEGKYAIQGLPQSLEMTIVPLGLHVKEAGQYKLKISHLNQAEGMDIFLYDALTDQLTNLKTTDYQVDLAQGEYTHRFSLRFIPSRVTSLDELDLAIPLTVYSAQGQLYLDALEVSKEATTIQLHDLAGRTVFGSTAILSEGLTQLSLKGVLNGIYIVKVQTEWGSVAKRIWVSE